jgi:exonuclease I
MQTRTIFKKKRCTKKHKYHILLPTVFHWNHLIIVVLYDLIRHVKPCILLNVQSNQISNKFYLKSKYLYHIA